MYIFTSELKTTSTMNTVNIILPNWIGTKTYMSAEEINKEDHRGKKMTYYRVINRYTSTSNGYLTTDTGKNTIYYPCDIIVLK